MNVYLPYVVLKILVISLEKMVCLRMTMIGNFIANIWHFWNIFEWILKIIVYIQIKLNIE